MGKPLSTYHVPAGTFHVGAKEPLMLQAYLGTCVGLALHCQATGVGGLIHLLLPEPVFSHACPQPEKYASTGIPLFIQSILDAGAHRETLSACLAGGALVGPLNHQDLDLDIGGRTAETAATILTEQQIKHRPVRNWRILYVLSEHGHDQRCVFHRTCRTKQTGRDSAGQDAHPG
jgi:chemotaxis receptor (MCP) glutamine deamidase CheD